jgi:hypothetical protein
MNREDECLGGDKSRRYIDGKRHQPFAGIKRAIKMRTS